MKTSFSAWVSRWESNDTFFKASFYRVVLWCGLSISLLLALICALFIWINESERFQREIVDVSAGVKEQVFIARNLMQSVRSFIHASEYVSPDEWETFLQATSLRNDLPEIKTIAWANRIPAGQLNKFWKEVHPGEASDPAKINPAPGENETWLIRYTDPVSVGSEWESKNLAFNKGFHTVLESILKNNQPAAICRSELFPDTPNGSRSVLCLLPVYFLNAPVTDIEDRRRAIQGLVILEIDLNTLFNNLQQGPLSRKSLDLNAALNFDDGMPETTSDDAISTPAPSSLFETTHSIPLGSSHLSLQYFAGPSFIRSFLWLIPPGVGLASAVVSVLLAGIFWLLANTRIRAEDLARQMTRQVRLQDRALYAIHQGVILVDALAKDYPVIYANHGFETITGYPRAEVRGRNCRFLQGKDRDELELEKIRIALRDGTPVSALLQNYRKDGSMFWNQVSVSPVAENGVVTHFVGVMTDVTENILKEHELQFAREEAEKASLAKSEFLANMSHEIRTPMNGVIGMISLLQDTELNFEQRDYVETVHQSGQALLRVINDILDFSKIESGRLELETASFLFSDCVEDAVLLFAKAAADKNIELSFLIHESVPIVILGDETRLRQIILNLIGNAVKFTPSGEIFMEVETEPIETPPSGEFSKQLEKTGDAGPWHRIKVSIRDSGEGIPASRLESIFESFTQVDASTTRRHGGTGLGLAICKRLVEIMDGHISAESQPGQGSTFSFDFITRQAPLSDHPETPGLEGVRGKTVLAVDDSSTNLRVLTAQLRHWGMESKTAFSAKEALDLLQGGFHPDLGILDFQMPSKNGAELASEIRSLPSCASLPLILLSSISETASIPSASKAHFSSILVKPAKKSRLLLSIQKAIAPRPKHPPMPAPEKPPLPSPLRKGLVLLVEDNKVNQQVGSLMLKKLGYEFDIAVNGADAVQSVQAKTYQTVLMDVQMPMLDGLEATRLIRRLKITQPRIIAMTANAMSGDREKCLEAGMDSYISKPLRLQTLLEALESPPESLPLS